MNDSCESRLTWFERMLRRNQFFRFKNNLSDGIKTIGRNKLKFMCRYKKLLRLIMKTSLLCKNLTFDLDESKQYNNACKISNILKELFPHFYFSNNETKLITCCQAWPSICGGYLLGLTTILYGFIVSH